MRFKLTIFFMLISSSLGSQVEKAPNGFDPVTDVISENYQAGPYLIYDCEENHWTCVMPDYFHECQEKRQRDVKARKLRLSCAPIGALPTKKSCFQRQLYLVGQNYGTRFCINDHWKQKELMD